MPIFVDNVAKAIECDDELIPECTESYEISCQGNVDIHFAVSEACGTAQLDLYACINQHTCEELDQDPCAAVEAVVDATCATCAR